MRCRRIGVRSATSSCWFGLEATGGSPSRPDGGDRSRELRAGELVIFGRGAVHHVSPIGTGAVVFLTADTPRRDPGDVHFVDPAAAAGKLFVSHLAGYEPAG